MRTTRITRLALVGALAAASAPPRPGGAQDTTAVVTGRVVDSAGTALAGAEVFVREPAMRVRVDSAGHFRLAPLPAGERLVTARRLGYRSATERVTLQRGERRELTFRLAVLPAPLDSVVSEAQATSENLRRSGFTRRQRMGFGYFVTRDEIAQQRPFDLYDLFQRVPFVQVVRGRAGGRLLVLQPGNCRPRVYLDGLPTIGLEAIPPEIVDGIEVYRHATDIPIEFSASGRACGAVLVWTR